MDPHVAANKVLWEEWPPIQVRSEFCHFGLDTLAWARRGARVTGIDISERGVEQARLLAAEMGMDATFVVSDVVELPDNEHPWVPWKMFPFMVETDPGSGVWRLPEPDDARLPLLFSLKATKPQ